jgi:hypothetical protein
MDPIPAAPPPDDKPIARNGFLAKLRAGFPAKPTSFWIVPEIAAILVWVYVLVQYFIFDVDQYAITLVDPKYTWIYQYKTFILLGMVCVFVFATCKRYRFLWIIGVALYITLYPLVLPLALVFWRLPRLAWRRRSWILAFALMNSAVSLYETVRYRLIMATLFLVSVVVIVKFSNSVLLAGALLTLLALLVVAYTRVAASVTRPPRIFKTYFKAPSPQIIKEGTKSPWTRRQKSNLLAAKHPSVVA